MIATSAMSPTVRASKRIAYPPVCSIQQFSKRIFEEPPRTQKLVPFVRTEFIGSLEKAEYRTPTEVVTWPSKRSPRNRMFEQPALAFQFHQPWPAVTPLFLIMSEPQPSPTKESGTTPAGKSISPTR